MARSSTSEVLRAHCAAIAEEEAVLREGGGKAGHERQRKRERLPVRERVRALLDKDSPFFEIGLWAAYQDLRAVGENPGGGSSHRYWECRGRSVHGGRQRRDGESRRVFPGHDQEGDSRAAESPSSARSRSFTLLIRPACFCRCRMKFFQMKMISAGSFAITQ